MFRNSTRPVRRFLRDRRAAATAYVAIGVVIMTVGGAAVIVDHDRLVDRRDLLKSAADAVSMSATLELSGLPSSMSDGDVEERLMAVARKYAVLNVLGNTNDPDLEAGDISVTLDIDRTAGTVGASVQADIGRTAISERLFGYSGPGPVARESAVESVRNAVEVVLAIDISASMRDGLDGSPAWGEDPSRMNIVRQAALDLVDILDPREENRVAVGLVPWHILVRLPATMQAGWAADGWATYPQSRNYAAAYACEPEGSCTAFDVDHTLPPTIDETWQGCLDEHRISGPGDHASLPAVSDLLAPPSSHPFAQAIFPSVQGVAYECLQSPLPDNFNYQVCYGDDPADLRGVYDRTSAQRGCTSPYDGTLIPSILPLTSDAAAVRAAINSLAPVGFRTYSTLGVLWGQRLLSHSWTDAWGGGVHPVDTDASGNAGTRKAIVLLTDGEDNPCGLNDPACETNDVGIDRAVACNAAKAAGTEIFVIAAMHPDNVSGTLGTALRACSSEAEKPDGTYVFLENRDPETLRAAFSDIARQLRTIRRIY